MRESGGVVPSLLTSALDGSLESKFRARHWMEVFSRSSELFIAHRPMNAAELRTVTAYAPRLFLHEICI
jgi:hypothetical protein